MLGAECARGELKVRRDKDRPSEQSGGLLLDVSQRISADSKFVFELADNLW